MTKNIKKILPFLFLLFLSLAFWYKIVFFKNTILSGFFLRYFFPYMTYFSKCLQSGIFPLWNPYLFCGTPFAANFQSAVFYPFTYLFAVLPFSTAMAAHTVIHAFLAGVFMYMFCRKFDLGVIPSMTGSVIWAFNGYFVEHVYFTSHVSSYIWLPLVLYCFHEAISRNEFKYALFASAALTLQLFGGYPVFSGFTIVIMLFYYIIVPKENKLTPGYIAIFILMILFFLMLSAIQLIPSSELLGKSVRGANFDYEASAVYSLSIKNCIQFLLVPLWNWHNIKVEGDPNIVGYYFGWAFISLVIVSFFKTSHKKYVIFYLAIFIVSLLYSLGRNFPLYRIFYEYIPLVRLVRFPAQILYITSFCAAVLCAIGMSKISSGKIKVIVLIVIILDLWLFAFKSIYVINNRYYAEAPENLRYFKGDPVDYRIMMTPKSRNMNIMKGADIYDAWEKYKTSYYPALCMAYGIYDASGYEELRLKSYQNIYESITTDPRSKWIDILGIKYMLSYWDMPGDKYSKIYSKNINIYVNKTVMKRVNFLTKQKIIEEHEILNIINSKGFNPAKEVLIGKNEETMKLEEISPNKGTAQIIHYTPQELRIKASSVSGGWVVLSDIWYPGWKVYINGKLSRLYCVNSVMRGVLIPAGQSFVRMIYQPLSFRIGLWISSITLIVFIFVLLFKRR